MQDPEIFLTELGITLACYMDSTQSAVLDTEHRSSLNYETYFFASTTDKARFDQDPVRYCGWLTDPVTRTQFHPNTESPREMFRDRLFLFTSDSTRSVFAAMPETYGYPQHDMRREGMPGMR